MDTTAQGHKIVKNDEWRMKTVCIPVSSKYSEKGKKNIYLIF